MRAAGVCAKLSPSPGLRVAAADKETGWRQGSEPGITRPAEPSLEGDEHTEAQRGSAHLQTRLSPGSWPCSPPCCSHPAPHGPGVWGPGREKLQGACWGLEPGPQEGLRRIRPGRGLPSRRGHAPRRGRGCRGHSSPRPMGLPARAPSLSCGHTGNGSLTPQGAVVTGQVEPLPEQGSVKPARRPHPLATP